ncbi:MAG: DUF2807 domain-containing protein [Treponema sp.]|jgi:hypothetical protein|nr:DUF2807 domain-containing protein [Treponema sp.]
MKKQPTSVIYMAIFTLIVMIFSSCVFINIGSENSGGDTIQASGDRETYEFNVGEFNKIRIEGTCEVRYYNGNSNAVTLLIQPNVREYFSIEAVNGELIVKTTRRITYGPPNKGPLLTIYAPALNQVTIDGAGIFTANDKITTDSLTLNINGATSGKAELDVNNLTVIMSGAGDLELSGRADISNITLSGAGNYNALLLVSRDATVNMAGVGYAGVNSSDLLNINANGAGSVEYKGSPSLNLNTSGMIGIRKVN